VPSRVRAEKPKVFATLAELVRQGSTTGEMYAAICVAATMTVPGCDHASLMVWRDGTRKTAAASDAVARRIDKLELALGSGPCIEAVETSRAQIESDLTASARWPALTERVVAETPVRGAMSVRLPVDRSNVGALNLFSDLPSAFDSTSVEHAVVLGAFATVAATAAAHSEDAATLRRGLSSNRVIGKAMGVLMALHDISDDAAFDMLRTMSQTSNVKLNEVAADIILKNDHRRPVEGS
jgi:ANTAR domain